MTLKSLNKIYSPLRRALLFNLKGLKMAFIVEDGTIVENATSYVSVAYADGYFLDRNNATWAAFTNAQKESYLILATDFIDTNFNGFLVGSKMSDAQPLQFPRSYNGLTLFTNNLLKAVCELAIRASVGDLMPDKEQSVKRQKLDLLEVEYDSYSDNQQKFSSVYALMREYLVGSVSAKKVVRA